jgi:hypothetical protein
VPGANINNKGEISAENYIRYIIDILGGVPASPNPPDTKARKRAYSSNILRAKIIVVNLRGRPPNYHDSLD